MRHDLLQDKKSVHINLRKDLHAALREKLFKAGLTMQDLFSEAAEMAVADTPRAQKLLDGISRKKMTRYLEGYRERQTRSVGELDSETLYNLLEENDRREEADEE